MTETGAERFMRELVGEPTISEAVVALDLQPHRALPRGRRPGRGREPPCSGGWRGAPGCGPRSSSRASTRCATATRRGICTGSPRGLESMVIGEAEVQGQVKRAYEAALSAKATGPLTNKLFRAALATGKRVRTETAISAGRASVASVAVDAARDALGDLSAAPRADHRRRRDRRADRAGAAHAGRADDVRRQPAARARDASWRGASAATRSRSTRCPTSWRRPTSSSPRPPRRTISSGPRSSRW